MTQPKSALFELAASLANAQADAYTIALNADREREKRLARAEAAAAIVKAARTLRHCPTGPEPYAELDAVERAVDVYESLLEAGE